MRKLKHIKRFNESNEENDPEYIQDNYDGILDIYNKYGLKDMFPSEIDFLKSGGKIGASFRNARVIVGQEAFDFPEDITKGIDKALAYLKSKGIEYSPEESYFPTIGVYRYYQTKDSFQKIGKEVFDKLKTMFPDTDKDSPFKFVGTFAGNSGDGIERICIFVWDPEWYKDIVFKPINSGEDLEDFLDGQ